MAEVTRDMIFTEILRLDDRVAETTASMQELLQFMRDMNRELAEGRAQTEALKKLLFGNRFDHQGALLG